MAYARCLNILGLLYYGLGSDNKSEEYILTGLEICKKSKLIKRKFGDIDGMAESDNAIALLLMEQTILPGKSKTELQKLLNIALENLERAMNTRFRMRNFRGCFQLCRNYGLAHTRLANLIVSGSEKEKYLKLVKKDYEDGITYLNRVLPEPPLGEMLECQFRIGELDVQFGDMDDAIKMLMPVESKRRELGDWHNRARTLDLLREAFSEIEQKKQCGQDIINIYKDVIVSTSKIKEIKDTRIKETNANTILTKTARTFESLSLFALRDEALKVREDLLKAIRQG